MALLGDPERERENRGWVPSPWLDEDAGADDMVDGEGATATGKAELPVTPARNPRSVGVVRWGVRHSDEPCVACRRPPPLYIAQCNRGPPTILGWAPRSRPDGPLGPHGWEITLTFSPLISTFHH